MTTNRGAFLDRSRDVAAEWFSKSATKWVVVVAVLLLSALLAYRAPGGRTVYLLIALGPALLVALLILRRLALGVLLVVVGGLLIPLNIGTGTGTTINPVIILVPVVTGLWVLNMAMRRDTRRLGDYRIVSLLLVFNAVVFLAFIVGRLPWLAIPGAGLAAQIGGLMVFFLSALAFLLAAHLLDERWLVRLVYTFIAIGALYLLGRLIPPIGAILSRFFTSGATGSVFWTWIVALPAGLALFHQTLTPGKRIALAAIALTALGIALGQNRIWASGWAPAVLALLILMWLRFPRWGWLPVLASMVLFATQLDRIWNLTTSTDSWLARQQAWQIVFDTTRINPLLGLGPSNYYYYVQQADISGWGGNWNVAFSSHNNWVDLIAQTGLIGTAVFVLFCFFIGRVGWRLYKSLPGGFARGYAAACLAGLIGTLASGMLGDWFLPFVYNVGLAGMRSSILFWVFLGGLLALQQSNNEMSRE